MRRLVIVLTLTFIMTGTVLQVMASLVGQSDSTDQQKTLGYNLVLNEIDSEPETRTRQLPERPPLESLKKVSNPSIRASSLANNVGQTKEISLSAFVIPPSKIAVSTPDFGQWQSEPIETDIANISKISNNQPLLPISKPKPIYPVEAKRRKVEGFVKVSFSIDGKGHTRHIKVIDAQPPRTFERSAIQAVRKWRYQPLQINGVPVEQDPQIVIVEFNLQ
ncbi:energy transducer TonB [Vibrio sonorensis]|uniref:energy transducer TonB n=1 Tax=Vibrio sonorensis TaxID=1004316 RepID=UPI0008DA59BA|nr:energy transducer TonB [Vibrio sonorensis]